MLLCCRLSDDRQCGAPAALTPGQQGNIWQMRQFGNYNRGNGLEVRASARSHLRPHLAWISGHSLSTYWVALASPYSCYYPQFPLSAWVSKRLDEKTAGERFTSS